MDGKSEDASTGTRGTFRSLLRVGIAALLLGPGASKFLTYGPSVRFFESLGLPAPDVLVPVVGSLEVGAAVLLLLDREPRAAAVAVLPVMLVAAVTAGPTWQNLGVLLAAVVLVGIDARTRGVSVGEPTT